jgi:hypothetical protein
VTVGSVRITDDNSMLVAIDGLPPQRVTILVDLTSATGRTTFSTQADGCEVTADRRRAACQVGASARSAPAARAGRTFRAVLPLAFPDDLRRDRLDLEVRLRGYDDPDSRDNRASVEFTPRRPPPPPPPPQARDISLELGWNGLGRGMGRFRVHVSNLDTTGDRRTPLQFNLAFSDARVSLERLPLGCRYLDAGRAAIGCTGHGWSYDGVFDADLRRLAKREEVTVRVTVAIPGVRDPRPEDNTRSITLRRPGLGNHPL